MAEEKTLNYRLGLDIGIASVGWSVLRVDEKGEPCGIENLGVRTFDPLEHPKNGASLTLPRRMARGSRRRLRRRGHRIERTKALLKRYFGENFIENIPLSLFQDPYVLRSKALDEKITKEELAVILLNLVKRRGFKSNRKSELKDDTDAGILKKAAESNRQYRIEKGFRTIGEMFSKDEKYVIIINDIKTYFIRNKESNYINSVFRDDLVDEIKKIFDCQKSLGNKIISDLLVDEYLIIFESQRAFDEGPGGKSPYRKSFNIGKCTFIKEENRAPKASYTFEYNIALQKINNLKITGSSQSELNEEQKKTLIDYILSSKEIKFSQVRKKLNIPLEYGFNLISYSSKKTQEQSENAVFVSMKNSYEIRKALSPQHQNNIDLLDEIAVLLSMNKSDDKILTEIKRNLILQDLNDEEINNLLSLNFSKFGYLSIKALKMIQPYLEKGFKYNKACELAGFDFRGHSGEERSKLLNTEDIRKAVNEINVPVVKRAISQSIKVINSVIREYGSPLAVNVELARELSKNREERDKIKKENDVRAVDNERLKTKIENEFGISNVKGQDIIKYRLYEEQKGKCAYSMSPIDFDRLFDPTYLQIDHIIPYSRSFDDSFNNKVLVMTSENQHKKNMTPYEYFGNNAERWKAFEDFVMSTYQFNRKKRDMMLRKSFTIDDEKEWKERSLNDTKYISKFIYNLINDCLVFDDSIDVGKKKVNAVNGKITSYLRKMWGIQKIREEGDLHHCLDATVIASVTQGIITKITNMNKIVERGVKTNGAYYDYETGERVDITALKEPYDNFARELKIRLSEEPSKMKNVLVEIGYDPEKAENIKPVFVSRMPTRKMKGKIHQDTIKSAKHLESEGIVVSKVDIKKLKLKDGEIENYYNPQDDLLLYNALKKRLQECAGDGEIAFKDGFYKPKSDGTQGNPVRKVKVYEKVTKGVELKKIKGFAANDSMARADIFKKDNKYYSVPVYVYDILKGAIPNKAIDAHKSYDEWTEIDNSFDFLFSLYPNDLVYLEHNKTFKLIDINKKEKSLVKSFLYYKGIDVSTGNASFVSHDQRYFVRIGLKTLKSLEKYTVDILGNQFKVEKEKRQLCNTKD